MTEPTSAEHLQALEAVAHDTVSLTALILGFKDHPHAPLLAFGLLPPVSMYVVESLRVIKAARPDVAADLLDQFAFRVHSLRHRAKLLDDTEKTIEQVASELAIVAERQKRAFLNLHNGILGPLKRYIQPDLGLFTYDGHIFATTHSIEYNFGTNHDLAERALSVGEALSAYAITLLDWFELEEPNPFPAASILPGVIEMKDIKSQALYGRGSLGNTTIEIASGMTLLLASLNNMHHIIQNLLPTGGHTQFRLKFIVIYHADSNLRKIQNWLAPNDSLIPEHTHKLFREVLGNRDSRWLRRQAALRNLLVHYSIDKKFPAPNLRSMNRKQVIEHYGGQLTFSEMDALLDRHMKRILYALEKGFDLAGDPFWYGRVA